MFLYEKQVVQDLLQMLPVATPLSESCFLIWNANQDSCTIARRDLQALEVYFFLKNYFAANVLLAISRRDYRFWDMFLCKIKYLVIKIWCTITRRDYSIWVMILCKINYLVTISYVRFTRRDYSLWALILFKRKITRSSRSFVRLPVVITLSEIWFLVKEITW